MSVAEELAMKYFPREPALNLGHQGLLDEGYMKLELAINEALERAAQECENMPEDCSFPSDCAERIRALKSRP